MIIATASNATYHGFKIVPQVALSFTEPAKPQVTIESEDFWGRKVKEPPKIDITNAMVFARPEQQKTYLLNTNLRNQLAALKQRLAVSPMNPPINGETDKIAYLMFHDFPIDLYPLMLGTIIGRVRQDAYLKVELGLTDEQFRKVVEVNTFIASALQNHPAIKGDERISADYSELALILGVK